MDLFTIRHGAASDRGLEREHNEDCYGVDAELGLYVVCDGLGGHRAGEIASARAVAAIRQYIGKTVMQADYSLMGIYRPEFSASTNRLAGAIRAANAAVYQEAVQEPLYAGMGTTVASVLVCGYIASIAHVGDSRVYLIRDGAVQALTCDHSVEAQRGSGFFGTTPPASTRRPHVLTRAVGVAATVDIDLAEIPLLSGDHLLLCSDGLHTLSDRQITQLMKERSDPQVVSEHLIALSKTAGSVDDTTAVIVSLTTLRNDLWVRLKRRLIAW